MVRIKYNTVIPKELQIDNLVKTGDKLRKVGVLRRKVKGKNYESPKIVLDSHFKDFIGRRFKVFKGRALHIMIIPTFRDFPKHIQVESTGYCLILFFANEKAQTGKR